MLNDMYNWISLKTMIKCSIMSYSRNAIKRRFCLHFKSSSVNFTYLFFILYMMMKFKWINLIDINDLKTWPKSWLPSAHVVFLSVCLSVRLARLKFSNSFSKFFLSLRCLYTLCSLGKNKITQSSIYKLIMILNWQLMTVKYISNENHNIS